MESQSRIAITMGDPAGIGPEIIVKAFEENAGVYRGIVVGDAATLRENVESFAPGLSLRVIQSPMDARFDSRTLEVLDLGNVPNGLSLGRPGPEGGRAAYEYIRTAVNLALENQVQAITTGPINKESLHLAGHPYPGHTELLADLTGSREVALMLAGRNLRVVLVTTHVPLDRVKSLIDAERVAQTIRLVHHWLLRHITEAPRIAVTGLNPHCGDGGIFGEEEQTAILPALETTRREGIQADGPFAADALFGRSRSGQYDAIIAMYHDQGMIPVKMESMGTAVNITLGLPIVRTSVDHGTAFDIVGKGTASPGSLLAALKTAAQLSKPTLAPQ